MKTMKMIYLDVKTAERLDEIPKGEKSALIERLLVEHFKGKDFEGWPEEKLEQAMKLATEQKRVHEEIVELKKEVRKAHG